MDERIEKVKELIKDLSKGDDWDFHQTVVQKYAIQLAKIKNADLELVQLASLLHDIGRLKHPDQGEIHDIIGVPEAEKVLKELNFPEETINEIKHAVEAHRGTDDRPAKTLLAEIIRNADAMSHFDAFPFLFKVAFRRNDNDLRKATQWIYNKIERNWDKKLSMPEAKEIIEEKYKAAKLILSAALGEN